MAQQIINATDVLNNGRVKINQNFTELYGLIVGVDEFGNLILGSNTGDYSAISIEANSQYDNVSLLLQSKGNFGASLIAPGTGGATLQSVAGAVNLSAATKIITNRPVVFPSYTVAQSNALTPSTYTGGMIFVTDESGGAVMAFSDGTNWRRVTDRAIIS